ncbi:cyaY protein [Vibrio cholerae]|nr:cyaY protein [Vibrio cholerae]
MNETEFHQLVDSQLERIEAAIDEAGADIDYETSGNVMTLEFDDGSQIIINRQEPMREIWLASKSGGYHFKSIDGEWICSNRVGGGITPAVLSHHRTSVDRIRRFRIDFQCFIPFQQ